MKIIHGDGFKNQELEDYKVSLVVVSIDPDIFNLMY